MKPKTQNILIGAFGREPELVDDTRYALRHNVSVKDLEILRSQLQECRLPAISLVVGLELKRRAALAGGSLDHCHQKSSPKGSRVPESPRAR